MSVAAHEVKPIYMGTNVQLLEAEQYNLMNAMEHSHENLGVAHVVKLCVYLLWSQKGLTMFTRQHC